VVRSAAPEPAGKQVSEEIHQAHGLRLTPKKSRRHRDQAPVVEFKSEKAPAHKPALSGESKTKSLAHGQKRRVPRRTKTGNRNLLVVVEKSIRCEDQWNRKQDRATTPHDGILEQKIG
jgi:hypothetical protein